MTNPLTRREFLAASAVAGVAATAVTLPAKEANVPAFKTTLHKALITSKINAKTLGAMKDAGFEGVECSAANVKRTEAEKARAVAEKVGMKIHSVLRGWMSFNSAAGVDKSITSVQTALHAAAGYGADAILVVPCRVGGRGLAIPQPWEFDIEFDPKTGHVSRVVKGDNTKYQAYIKAQNQATDMSVEALKRLIPTAAKTKVVIAIENVWNNLWVKPDLAANLIRLVNSPWVQYYFDIGNHVKYAPPEQWIRTLGKMIVKCHVKDFKLNANGQGGKFCNIRDGSVNWPLFRKELDKIGYSGWMTIEGSGRLSLKEKSKRLDLIVAGK